MTLTLVRKPGWPELLAHFLHTRAFLPFAWGLNDCALFAADCVHDLTGVDPAEDLRGSYSDGEGADEILRRHGGLRSIVRARLPMYANVLQAHRGDVVCVALEQLDGSTRDTLGVVAGNGCWAAPGEQGMIYRPIAEVEHAYAVG